MSASCSLKNLKKVKIVYDPQFFFFEFLSRLQMKKIFFAFLVLLFAFAAGAAELFYNDGTSIKMEKAGDFGAVRRGVSDSFIPKNELYRLNTGKNIFSIVSGKGELPVYFLGDMPVVAEQTVFWRGEKPVEYMEKKYGMKLAEVLPAYPLYAFSVQGDSVEIAEKIVKNGDGYAFPDLVRETTLRFVPEKAPKDPYFDMQWHLQNKGKITNYRGQEIEMLKNADVKFIQMLEFLNANKINVDTNTKIAIMDTGIVPDHKDLTNIEPGYDIINDEEGGYPDLSPLEDYVQYLEYVVPAIGHGTTCAGVSAGVGNEIGMSGMCPWCKLYPVRYLNGLEGTATVDSMMFTAYDLYVEDPEITTINCSFGPDSSNGTIPVTPAEIESITNFMQNGRGGKGGVVVYASGNDGVDSSYEKLLGYNFVFERNGVKVTNRVVTVNASSAWDTRIEYSNYGAFSTVSAPSLSEDPLVGIATATIPDYGNYKNDYTLGFSGTSAAAPVVSGLFGAIFSINPELTLEEAMEILKKSADKINPETGLWDEKGFSVKFGYGRVNLEKAARLAAGYPMCADVKEEVCGNHLDDDCDGYVDEGCSEKLTAGNPCEKAEDCLNGSLTLDDVECLKVRQNWSFKDGYCAAKSGRIPCPDGTRAFDTIDRQHDLCALECNSQKPCEREGYYCSDEVLGICLPGCSDNSDCNTGSFCNEDKRCEKSPAPIGGSCSENSDCAGDANCVGWFFEGGYCTTRCSNGDDSTCPGDAKCATMGMGQRKIMLCLASCASDKDCRTDEGYRCQPQFGSKSGVCYQKCSENSECSDEDATCTEDGHCAPENWEGWPEEEESDTDSDTDSGKPSEDEAGTHESEKDEMYKDDESVETKKSDGCSVIVM